MDPGRSLLKSFHQNLYLSLTEESKKLVGKIPDSLKKYEQEYHKNFSKLQKKHSSHSSDELVNTVIQSNVTLIGDYHPYSQSQKTLLRFLRQIEQNAPKRHKEIVIGFEIFPSDLQNTLHQFTYQKITLQKLIQKVQSRIPWKFPWRNYYDILEYSQKHQIPLIALNKPSEHFKLNESLLNERDQWAAQKIIQTFNSGKYSKNLLFLGLFGELHLSTNHLPLALKQVKQKHCSDERRFVFIHQNNDQLFWKLHLKGNKNIHTTFLKLQSQESIGTHYCVFSGTPWTKLQSLINWIEDDVVDFITEELDEDNEDEGHDHESEFHHWVKHKAQHLADLFNLEAPHTSEILVYGSDSLDFYQTLPSSLKWMRTLMHSQERIYLRPTQEEDEHQAICYLPSFSENSAAECAALHLIHSHTLRELPKKFDEEYFYQLMNEYAFAFMGSLLLNPKRKCDFSSDHLKRYETLKKESHQKSALYPHELESRAFTLQLLKLIKNNKDTRLAFSRHQLSKPTLFTTARYMGHLVGYALYQLFTENKITLNEMRKIFFEDYIPVSHRLQFESLIQVTQKALFKVQSKHSLF